MTEPWSDGTGRHDQGAVMTSRAFESSHRRFTVAALLLGFGLGGFVVGIVLHQILQWHHMLTDYGSHASFPATDVRSLEENTLWDGLFHACTWLFVLVGLLLMWRVLTNGYRTGWRSAVGLLLAGWGHLQLHRGRDQPPPAHDPSRPRRHR
jgi:uncharacterized membrane protein